MGVTGSPGGGFFLSPYVQGVLSCTEPCLCKAHWSDKAAGEGLGEQQESSLSAQGSD